MPSKSPRHQSPIFSAQGVRVRRESLFSALHPAARAELVRLAKLHGVSRSWLAAFMIESFLYGKGKTYAEDPRS